MNDLTEQERKLTRESYDKLIKDMWTRKEPVSGFVLGKNGIKALEEVFKKK
jgi:hypothetical protein